MKLVRAHFYSYRPRIIVYAKWSTDCIPNTGDFIVVPSSCIEQWDKKYFEKWEKERSRRFKVKRKVFDLDNGSLDIELDWTDEEKREIEKYLKACKKK